ncbi:uncharacterized protein L201_006752 [Kwoniella dendrophila CBS 6074]|uniref:Zn(2)-C6 fungal-type domain-containing protein n=1 Tax=Kwoniella dendrophila CBS 6074 TaxID=1295534 RepID=A0AAX4K4X0_9TREE
MIPGVSGLPPQTQPGSSGIGSSSGTSNVASSSTLTDNKKKKDEKEGTVPKRGYRACVHCRLRKAKCDLGDVNAPSEPPCSRCRREQRDCVFLPSKRRRKTSTATDNAIREASVDNTLAEVYPAHGPSSTGSTSMMTNQNSTPSTSTPLDNKPNLNEWNSGSSFPHIMPTGVTDDRIRETYSQHPRWSDNNASHYTQSQPPPPQQQQQQQPQAGPSRINSNMGPSPNSHQMLPPPSTSAPPPPQQPLQQQPQQQQQQQQQQQHTGLTPQQNPDMTTPGSIGESSIASTSGHSPGYRSTKKRRTTEPEGTRQIVNASLSNEMDALEILANAATDENGELDHSKPNKHHHHNNSAPMDGETKRVSWNISEESSPVRELEEFHLIKIGILDENTLQELVNIFFKFHHPSLPIFQTARIPRNREQLLDLAHNDPFLLTCIVAVASRHPVDLKYKEIHDKTWPILREVMSDYSFAGLPGSVGFVEGVLLLAEHLPREKATPPKQSSLDMLAGPGTETAGEHGTDNRISWSLTGLAIRAAYRLGLDQIALEINEDERNPDVERIRRLAFWSRGPSLCFVGYSHISQTGETAARINFPLQLSPGTNNENDENNPEGRTHDDSASLMQALVELTQIMTNAHDILYPSKSRTAVLVRQGEYFLFLDHFRRALDSYKLIWKPKKWSNQTLHELSWMTYQFVRLYVSSFGYSAHVKRAQWRAEAEAQAGRDGGRQSVQLFPRGSATSPDAIYIYESIGSANEIMAIALRLSHMGSLRFLPSRYLINISYAAVFALKSSYSGAVTGKDVTRIRELVDHVCAALVLACPDKDHPANKYGHMLRMLSKKLEQLSDASAVPSRFPSPEPTSSNTPAPTNSNHQHTHPHSEPTPLPWTLPAETMDTQSAPFTLPPFEFNFLPHDPNTSHLHNNNNQQQNNQASSSSNPIVPNQNNTGGGVDYMANLGLGLGATNANITQHQQHQQSLLNNLAGQMGGNVNQLGQNQHNQHISSQNQNQEGLFDFDTNFDFDLKGFWDDFTLGEGSGFPFR